MTTRKIALFLTAFATVAATASACRESGGGSDRANGQLTTGAYALTTVDIVDDGCDFLGGFQPGAEFGVIVSSASINFIEFDLTGTYDDGTFDIDRTEEYDLREIGIDCVVTGHFTMPGRATADDVLFTTLTRDYVQTGGSDCGGLNIPIPCNSVVDFTATRFGELPPQPTPITGTLTTAFGFNAQLGQSFGTAISSSNFAMSAILDGEVVGGPSAFTCYKTGTAYRVLALPDTFTFSMTVSSSLWTVGSHPIDGVGIYLYVDNYDIAIGAEERYGEATGGTLEITSAPTTTAGTCSFNLANVPLAGEKNLNL